MPKEPLTILPEEAITAWNTRMAKHRKNPVDRLQDEAGKVYHRDHEFQMCTGFLEYLNSPHCAPQEDASIICFVQSDKVIARLEYPKPKRDQAILTLDYSEEMEALAKLSRGVTQKELWRLLITKLYGCVDDALLAAISSLDIVNTAKGDVVIDTTGLVNASATRQINLSFADPKGEGSRQAKIGTEWDFTVRMWESFDGEWVIPTTLELDLVDDIVNFVFHLRRERSIELQARNDLAKHLADSVPNHVTVYEGTF